MIYTETKGDLFNLPNDYYLCHCISADFALGKGIAVEFNKRYDMKRKLKFQYPINGPFPRVYLIDKVFNLVTKEHYWDKPTYETMNACLVEMRNQAIKNNVKYLGMPIIGCGLDRLEWAKVSQMIRDVFKDTDIIIKVVIK